MTQPNSLILGFLDGIRPPKRLKPSDWADEYRFLSSSASAEPGKWRTDRTPYLREIMDRFYIYDDATEVVVMKGAQIGMSEAGFNIIGYYIATDPCPIMDVMPTIETMKRNVKMRVNPMIESTPVLSDKINVKIRKDSSNSLSQKDFSGGTLILSGANSASSLRSVPIKVLVLDEVDEYPLDLDGQGSPIDLAKARTRTFAKKKIFYLSTPLIHGSSVIEKLYLKTSQRKFFVPCPKCKEKQTLEFNQIKWTKDENGDPIKVFYECCECGHKILEHHKTKMLAAGEWRDTVERNVSSKKYGYHINSLYSPLGWYSWTEAAADFLAAQKDVDKLKVFKNTVLGETWMQKGERPDWENLYNRRIDYPTNTPNKKVCVITAGVDVQKDRLELEIVGWCPDKSSYSIDYRVLSGDTASKTVWNELAKVVTETWTRVDGVAIPLYLMGIDSGFNTAEVYEFCRRFHPSQVVPIKGQAKQPVIVSQPRGVDQRKGKRKHSLGGLTLYNIGVSILKSELYGWLKQKIENGEVPAGYCFFPKTYDEHFFKMLTAEQLTKRIVKGYNVYEWEKLRERNESLDCRVYARAAMAIAGCDRWKPENWAAVVSSYIPKSNTSHSGQKKKKSDFW